MLLHIHNFTNEPISCHATEPHSRIHGNKVSDDAGVLLGPGKSTAVPHHNLSLIPSNASETGAGSDSESKTNLNAGAWRVDPDRVVIKVSLALGKSWKPLKLEETCPWRIYIRAVSRKHRRMLVFPRRNLAAFMSEMPDGCSLASLMLPGTHDTMAFYGWPISQCQSKDTPLSLQLQSGIRVIDIRLAIVEGRLIAYHGLWPQRAPFQSILADIHTFLTAQTSSREALVMSIKQEDYATTPPQEFSALVHKEIFDGPGGRAMWFLENRIPRLGEVRGKVVMLSRFGGDGTGWEGGLEGLGIHPTTWPDSKKDGFTWNCKDTLVRMHDWYNIDTFLAIPEKVDLSTKILLPPPNNPPMPVLSFTYLSAASFPLGMPPTIALGFGWPNLGLGVEGVNSRVGRWLLDMLSLGDDSSAAEEKSNPQEGPRIRGWAMMDYFAQPEGAVVPLMVECNYRGRKEGEEGW